MAETSSSEDDERLGRSRSREDRENWRGKRRRRRSSASLSDSSSSESVSSSSDESSDGERRRRDKKRKKEKKRKTPKSDKDKSREERHRDRKKRKKKHQRSEDSDESYDSDSAKKRRLLKEAKELLRKHKSEQKLQFDKSSGARPSNEKVVKIPDVDRISEDHYFVKSNEFATWLREEYGIYFSDLSSEDTHKQFLKFVDVWNAGKLSHKYYEGIKKASRTNHNWAIKKGPEDSVVVDEEEEYAVAKNRERLERKKFQKDNEAVLDDLLPKATGRERLMEMKAVRREQARAREDSPELMRERDVMGGGDDFQSRLAREKARREKRQSEKAAVYSEKRSAFEEKEAAAMDQLRALVNVTGGKITLAKRET